jgi:hypothetical protein
MDVTAETNSLNSLLLPEEEPIGYKPFGLPESALPVKTRAVCIHEFASALVFIEGAWLCAKGLAQFGVKHIAESKTMHVFFVLESRLKRWIHPTARGVLEINPWSMSNYCQRFTETVQRLRLWLEHAAAHISIILPPKSFCF